MALSSLCVRGVAIFEAMVKKSLRYLLSSWTASGNYNSNFRFLFNSTKDFYSPSMITCIHVRYVAMVYENSCNVFIERLFLLPKVDHFCQKKKLKVKYQIFACCLVIGVRYLCSQVDFTFSINRLAVIRLLEIPVSQ